MGSEDNNKRLVVEVDRLSNLPDDLIHKILSLNDSTLDAVKTSSFTSRWRFIWTTMTCLAFSSEDFPDMRKFSNFVKHVLSGRDNQREVSSVKLTLSGNAIQAFVKRILNYAFSHNVQQLDITFLADSKIKFPLSLFSSQTLKHLILKKSNNYSRKCNKIGTVTLTSTWEVPALTTLHLDAIMLSREDGDYFSGLISKCVNLKNLTLKRCYMVGLNNICFNIFHPELSNLALEDIYWNARLLSVVAPKLKNLIIKRNSAYRTSGQSQIKISAPDLAFLLLQCHNFLNFSADDFHSLEKADISFTSPYKEDPQNIVGLFQLLQSARDLTLNMEILEQLLSSVEIISHQPSPFANLKSIKIYPFSLNNWPFPRETGTMSMKVKNYLLAGSPGATFTMVSREDIIAENNFTCVKQWMASLQMCLEREKSDIATNRTHHIEGNVAHINSCWESLSEHIKGNVAHMNSSWNSLSEQFKEGKDKIDGIVRQLRHIEKWMTKLHASKRAEIQPCFSSLCAQADIVMSKIRDCMKIQLAENQSSLNACIHELSSTLQSSS